MEIEDVLNELNAAAKSLGVVAPRFGTSKGKAYEVWIMLELAVRLLQRDVEIYPHDSDDQIEPYFRVSGSPANMPAKGSGSDGPCHFKLVKNGREFELHLGLNNKGLSTASHEIDLVLIHAIEGLSLRNSGGGPFEGHALVGLELKAYSDKHKLDHGIPRALLGVALDLDPAWAIQGWTFHTVGGAGLHLSRAGKLHLSVLTSTRLYESSETLLRHHGAGAHSLVIPGANDTAIDEVVELIYELFT